LNTTIGWWRRIVSRPPSTTRRSAPSTSILIRAGTKPSGSVSSSRSARTVIVAQRLVVAAITIVHEGESRGRLPDAADSHATYASVRVSKRGDDAAS
jgi:hypothetical protein